MENRGFSRKEFIELYGLAAFNRHRQKKYNQRRRVKKWIAENEHKDDYKTRKRLYDEKQLKRFKKEMENEANI